MQTAISERSIPQASSVIAGRHAEPIMATAPLGRIGTLEVRLARSEAEIAAAQEVRFRVFFDELGAKQSLPQMLEKRDADGFDDICDHLLVFDTALPGPSHRQIVGTYRLLRQEAATTAGGFYSDDEFDVGALIARHPGQRFLELGRSCVLPAYRSKRTIEVLWQGIWAYVNRYGVDVMSGCASFQGTDPEVHAEALTFLAQTCRAAPEWDVRAVASRYQPMDLVRDRPVNMKAALAVMPPLIKGYLRLGAKIGDGCVIDHDFGTVDVFMVMPVEQIAARYVSYYGAEAA